MIMLSFSEAEYAAACHRAALFDLSARGHIELAGPDARLFLHNLCTNDVKTLPLGGSCEAFLCTAKARVIAHILVGHYRQAVDADTGLLRLDCAPGFADKVLKHLDHYLISERVELADRTAQIALLRVCGPESRQVVQTALGEAVPDLAELQHITRSFDGGVLHIRRQPDLGVPAYDLLCASASAPPLRQALLAAGAVPAGPAVHETLRVEAGTPLYGPDIDDNRLVMEVGRTKQAISYAKGCFLGQEPIVMARDRGHVNRTLLGVTTTGALLAPGARLFKEDAEAGQVTSSVWSPRLGRVIGLAYLKRGCQDPGTALVVEPASDGRTVHVASLPFVSQNA
jgi:folate-binding protein YgfZ